MKKAVTLSIICAFIVVACAKKSTPTTSTPAATTPVESPESEKASQEPVKPVVSAEADLSSAAIAAKGKIVYETKCGRCHALKTTTAYTSERWDGILASMIPKAKLNDEETKQVTVYVKENAKK